MTRQTLMVIWSLISILAGLATLYAADWAARN
jgi:hypothetical protein